MPLNSINISDPEPGRAFDLVDLLSGSFSPHASCSDLYKVPADLRCTWVKENVHCYEGTTIIKYIPFLICNFTAQTLFIGIISLLVFLVILFIILGTVADEFFCPNLEVIAKSLKLSEATAGVTILAFGNGSPDIFTSLAGIPRGHVELIFCELIGGGIFITTVLVGTICIKYPINVVGRILLRDVCFYLVALAWTYYTFNKHYLTTFDTGGYLFIYGVYLLVVIYDRHFRRSFVNRASQLIPESDLERLRQLYGSGRRSGGSQQGSKPASRTDSKDQNPGKDGPESKESIHSKQDERKSESKGKKQTKKKTESKGSIHEKPDEMKPESKGKKQTRKKTESTGSLHEKPDESKPESKGKKQTKKKTESKGSLSEKPDEKNPNESKSKGKKPPRERKSSRESRSSRESSSRASKSSQGSKSISFDENVKDSEGEEKNKQKSKNRRSFFQICFQSKTEDETSQPSDDVEKNIEKNTWWSCFQTCCQTEDETTQSSHDVEKNAEKSKNWRTFFQTCCQCTRVDETTQSSHDVKNTEKSKSCWAFFDTCCENQVEDETSQPLLGDEKTPPKNLWTDFKEEIDPITKQDWETSSCFFRSILVIKSPAVLFLKLTIPVVTLHKPMRGWCKLLSVLLCITFPLYIIATSGYAGYRFTKHKFPLIILILAVGKLFSLFVFFTSLRNKEPPYHIIFAFLGFLGSIFTVFTVANEVVNLMWAVGIVVGISEATLGLTVLSWGTQIGDFISILALVRAGYERMGFVACFGGSLFNVIMSIGLAFTIATFGTADRRLAVHYGKMGLVCLAFLAVSLVSSFLAFPLMRFRTRSFFGVYLYVLYALFLTTCLLNEFDAVRMPGTPVKELTTRLHTRRTTTARSTTTEEAVVWDFR